MQIQYNSFRSSSDICGSTQGFNFLITKVIRETKNRFCLQDIQVGDEIGLKDLTGKNREANGKNAIVKQILSDGEYVVDYEGVETTVQKAKITEPYTKVKST